MASILCPLTGNTCRPDSCYPAVTLGDGIEAICPIVLLVSSKAMQCMSDVQDKNLTPVQRKLLELGLSIDGSEA